MTGGFGDLVEAEKNNQTEESQAVAELGKVGNCRLLGSLLAVVHSSGLGMHGSNRGKEPG